MIGLVPGVAGALGLSRFLTTLLYEIKPTDPVTFVVVAGALLCTALAASWIPARRAARINPMEALRAD